MDEVARAPRARRSPLAAERVRGDDRVLARIAMGALLAVILFGVLLRFTGLTQRVFWSDEAITALRVGGATYARFVSEVYDGRVHSVGQIAGFIDRTRTRTASDVIASLAREDAQHPPLYYLAAYAWQDLAGPSPAALRVFSALIGASVPFAVAWLCFELFGQRRAALLGGAFASVSPVLVIYSQQAREYGLWVLLTVIASALLIRAARSQRAGWWIAYASVATLGLYTDTIFVLVLAGHVYYAAVSGRLVLRAYALACGAAVLLFAPWIAVMLRTSGHIASTNAWTSTPWPLTELVAKWVFNAGSTFFDLEYLRLAFVAVIAPIALLVLLAVYDVWRNGTRSELAMLVALALPTALVFVVSDLVLHAHRSSVTRYGMAIYIALILLVTGMLARRSERGATRTRLAWGATACALLAVMTLSSFVDVHQTVWWDNREDRSNPAIARRVNASPGALLVIVGNGGRFLSLAALLGDRVQILAVPDGASVRIPPGFSPVYVFGALQRAQNYRTQLSARALEPVVAERDINASVASLRAASPHAHSRTETDADDMALWRLR